MKKNILKLLSFLINVTVFPISRWHISNLFLYKNPKKWLDDKPSMAWQLFGKPFWYLQRLISRIHLLYLDAIVCKYSQLIKRHYLDNYAYDNKTLSDDDYQNYFKVGRRGDMRTLFENDFFITILDIKPDDSFLDCGCGEGVNIKEIFMNFPNAKVIAFDISPNAVDFAKNMFKDKSVDIFQGSVLDMSIFKRFSDNSVDHVFFARVLSSILCEGIEDTRLVRQAIVDEAVRITRKNVIITQCATGDSKIHIEQKYRALFHEDFSLYFEKFRNQGDILFASKIMIFRKKHKLDVATESKFKDRKILQKL